MNLPKSLRKKALDSLNSFLSVNSEELSMAYEKLLEAPKTDLADYHVEVCEIFEFEFTVADLLDKINPVSTVDLRPKTGEYCVYKNELWRKVSNEGAGKNLTIGLENSRSKIFVKLDKIKQVKTIIKPTGYIELNY